MSSNLKERKLKSSETSFHKLESPIIFAGFLTIPKPSKGSNIGHVSSQELKEYNNAQAQLNNEDKSVKLKKNVDLFSGIALIVGTMIGKQFQAWP